MADEWSTDEALKISGLVLQSLLTHAPNLKYESADAHGKDGAIYFINDAGERVRVTISREALLDYIDAEKYRRGSMELRFAALFEEINHRGELEPIIRSDHFP